MWNIILKGRMRIEGDYKIWKVNTEELVLNMWRRNGKAKNMNRGIQCRNENFWSDRNIEDARKKVRGTKEHNEKWMIKAESCKEPAERRWQSIVRDE